MVDLRSHEYAARFGGHDLDDDPPRVSGGLVQLVTGIAIGAAVPLLWIGAYYAGTWAFGL